MVRIGLWGTYDVEHLGDVLPPRVLGPELERRLPGARCLPFAPLGYVGLNRYEGAPSAPLGAWSEDRVDALAKDVDLLVIGAGSIAHGDDARLAPWYGLPELMLVGRAPSRFFIEGLGKHEVDVPTAWLGVELEPDPPPELAARWRDALAARAFVGVRDEVSRRRLEEAGVDRPIEVVPDPTYLLPRSLPAASLAPRIDRMRASGDYPPGEVLLVQGGASELAHVDDVAAAVDELARGRSLTPVIVETDPIHGDRGFADALGARLPAAGRLPASAGIEDVAAAIAWAAGVVGRSRALHVLAAAYDRPAVLVDLEDAPRFAELVDRLGVPERRVTALAGLTDAFDVVVGRGSVAPLVEAQTTALDEALDRIAALVSDAGVRTDAPPVMPSSTVADERERYAIATRSLATRMAAMQAAFAERERDLRAYADAVHRELVERDIRFTKLWRRVHEGDRHYHYHQHRADQAEHRIADLEREIEFLRGAKVGPWVQRRVRLFLWRLRPTIVGRALARALALVGGMR